MCAHTGARSENKDTIRTVSLLPHFAPVVQWIELLTPNEVIHVRLMTGAPNTSTTTVSVVRLQNEKALV